MLVVRDQGGVDKPSRADCSCSCFSLDRSLNRSLLPVLDRVSLSLFLILLSNGCLSVRPVIVSGYPGQNAVISPGRRGAMIAGRVHAHEAARRAALVLHQPSSSPCSPKQKVSNLGVGGYRSPYLTHAKRALYHLSYDPLTEQGPPCYDWGCPGDLMLRNRVQLYITNDSVLRQIRKF